ncbi:hypothetical protein ACHQM5_027236 [Ranunculus cassubicifolius]
MATSITTESEYNRAEEVKAFDETKSGVKGLVDSGLQKIPRIFRRPSNELHSSVSVPTNPTKYQVPVIDLHSIKGDKNRREKIVEEIKNASENWGFFQVVNHGVGLSVLEGMIQGVIRFHEQDDEVKKQYYSRDRMRKVTYSSNFDLYTSKAANWRDTLTFRMTSPEPVDPQEIPPTCRDITLEYTKEVTALGETLFQLLSEALGLKSDHLKEMQCDESCTLVSHYYPPCPEPELTLGTSKHTDPAFLTILLQDQIGGLQVLHQDHWVDIHPIPGAFVINIADLLQIVSNDKFKSVEHRVLANHIGPRVSVACFFNTRYNMIAKSFGPIKELVSPGTGPIYRDLTMMEYFSYFESQGLQGKPGLENFKI